MSELYTNVIIHTGEEVLTGRALLVRDGVIADIVDGDHTAREYGAREVDLQGARVAPGLVDLQVNGGGDVLFNDDPSTAALRTVVSAHRRLGTTSIVPTYITGPRTGMYAALEAARSFARLDPLAVLGIHFEGPALNPLQAGVHDSRLMVNDFPADLVCTDERFKTLITLAPEVVGEGLIQQLRARGAALAVGHSDADADSAIRAIREGATLATHLFNGMSQLTGRNAGVVGAFLSDDDAFVDVIPDGIHVSVPSLGVALRAKPKGKLFFVSDAMPSVGGTSTAFRIGAQSVVVRDGRCLADYGGLAGSAIDLATGVRTAIERLEVPWDEALRLASLYPSQYLGVDDVVGRIEIGFAANLIVLAQSAAVERVIYRGIDVTPDH